MGMDARVCRSGGVQDQCGAGSSTAQHGGGARLAGPAHVPDGGPRRHDAARRRRVVEVHERRRRPAEVHLQRQRAEPEVRAARRQRGGRRDGRVVRAAVRRRPAGRRRHVHVPERRRQRRPARRVARRTRSAHPAHITRTRTHTHTHTHTTVLRPFVRDYPGEPVPEETFTLSHPS